MAKEKINFEDEQVRLCYRHTTSHILAQAVKKLWPDAKLAIGPAIDNGFYYDFDMEHKLNDQDLLKIQKLSLIHIWYMVNVKNMKCCLMLFVKRQLFVPLHISSFVRCV